MTAAPRSIAPMPHAQGRITTRPSISAQNKAATAMLRSRVRRWNASPPDNLPAAASQNVPLVRILPITAPDGTILREPNLDQANWDDPDDISIHRRTRRQIHSFRRADPLLVAQRLGSPITSLHITAANLYRLAHELGPGGGRASKSLAEATTHAPSPAAGPSHRQLMAMRDWIDIQAKLTRDAAYVLEVIVLNHNSISFYAQQNHRARETTTTILVEALDRLVIVLDCQEPRK